MSSLCTKNAQDTTTGTTPQDTVTHSTRDVLKKEKRNKSWNSQLCNLPGRENSVGERPYLEIQNGISRPLSSRGVTLRVEQKGCACVCKPDPSATRCGPGSLTAGRSCLRCTWNAGMLIFSHFQGPTSLQWIEIPDLLTNSPQPEMQSSVRTGNAPPFSLDPPHLAQVPASCRH